MSCKNLVNNTFTQTEIAMRQLQFYYVKEFVGVCSTGNHFLFYKGQISDLVCSQQL